MTDKDWTENRVRQARRQALREWLEVFEETHLEHRWRPAKRIKPVQQEWDEWSEYLARDKRREPQYDRNKRV